jgi:hypothetical protein
MKRTNGDGPGTISICSLYRAILRSILQAAASINSQKQKLAGDTANAYSQCHQPMMTFSCQAPSKKI